MTLAWDTSILIEVDLLNKAIIDALDKLRVHGAPALPSPVVSEYYYGFLGTKKKEQALRFIEGFEVLNTSKNSSLLFAEIKNKLIKAGKILPDMDIMIASVCMANNATLVTMGKDFKSIKELNSILIEP